MKNIFIALFVCSVALVGCKKKGCTDPNASNYDSSAKKDNGSCNPSGYYMFDLTVNGVNHKIEGYSSDNISYIGSNYCSSVMNNTGVGVNSVYLCIGDTTSNTSFINGSLGNFSLNIFNETVGVCNGNIFMDDQLTTSNLYTFLPSNGYNFCNLFYGYTLTPTDTNSLITTNGHCDINIPINIIDLGTSSSGHSSPAGINDVIYGEPLIGNFTDTIYLCSGSTVGVYHYDYSVIIDLDFVAQKAP